VRKVHRLRTVKLLRSPTRYAGYAACDLLDVFVALAVCDLAIQASNANAECLYNTDMLIIHLMKHKEIDITFPYSALAIQFIDYNTT